MANTIPANNNTGLYNTANATPTPVGNTTYVINLQATGYISAAGNITTGSYFIGDGSQLTNLPLGNYANANVANYLPVYGGNVNSTTLFHNTTGIALQSNTWSQLQYTANAAAPVDQTNIGNGSWFYIDSTGAAFESNITGTVKSIALGNDGSVSAVGNVSGAYILGDGSQLTNLPTGNYSNANVAAYLPTYTGALAGANLSVTGNISGSYILGNGSQLTGITANYGNANVAAFLPTYTGPLTGSDLSVTGNVTGSNLYTTGVVSAVGNVRGANFNTIGLVSATGNVQGAFILGDGSQLTNLPTGNYSNANVANYLPTFSGNLTANTISATGNVQGAFILGDGSQLTNLPTGNYSNANVANYLPTFSGNLTAGNISTTGLISATGTVFANAFTVASAIITTPSTGVANLFNLNATTVNLGGAANTLTIGSATSTATLRGNVLVNGFVSAAGNVTGNYFIGNGSQLTGITTTYSNANVVSLMAAFGSNTISTTGNVTVGNLIVSGTETDTGNITGGNLLTGGIVSATGNITGNYFVGNGSQLTGITATADAGTLTGNTLSANVLFSSLTSVGNLTNLIATGITSLTGNTTIGGVLSASGNITGSYITATGNITAGVSGTNYFFGNASQLVGTIPAANVATYSNISNANGASSSSYYVTFTGGSGTQSINIDQTGSGMTYVPSTAQLYLGIVTATGNVAGGNITTAGLVTATGNITGGNILTAGIVSSTGNAIHGNILTAGVVSSTGNAIHGNISTAGLISAVGNITGNYFIGNGSQLTGLPAGYSDSNVVTLLSAFGSNSISTTGNISVGNLVVSGTDVDTGNITGGNLLTGGLVSATGNVTGGNIITAGIVSAGGNITGNILTAGVGSRIYGSFAVATAVANRTYFQSSTAGSTFTGAIPGVGFSVANGTVSSAVTAFGNTDPANSSAGGIYVAYGNASTGYVAVRSSAFGTSVITPLIFQLGTTEKMRLDTNGNLGVGNTAPVTTLAVTGTAYVSGNVTMASLAQVGTYTVTALTAITGVSGQYAAVSNGTGKNNGQLAYWDVTNTRWSWVDTNLAVS